MLRSFFPTFPSRSLMDSDLTFKSLIHFMLIWGSGIRQGSIFIFLHEYPIFPATFIKEIVISPLSILESLVKYQLTIYAWVYIWHSVLFHWSICLFLCQYHTVLITIVLQDSLKSGKASCFVLLSQDSFGYLGSFVVPYKFQEVFFCFCKKWHWNLDRDCTKSIDGFWQY